MSASTPIHALWCSVDADGNGTLDPEELKHGLFFVGCSLKDDEVQNLFESMDINGDGVISLTEFKCFVSARGRNKTELWALSKEKHALKEADDPKALVHFQKQYGVQIGPPTKKHTSKTFRFAWGKSSQRISPL